MNNMNNMTTSFGGLLLRSPVIVGQLLTYLAAGKVS